MSKLQTHKFFILTATIFVGTFLTTVVSPAASAANFCRAMFEATDIQEGGADSLAILISHGLIVPAVEKYVELLSQKPGVISPQKNELSRTSDFGPTLNQAIDQASAQASRQLRMSPGYRRQNERPRVMRNEDWDLARAAGGFYAVGPDVPRSFTTAERLEQMLAGAKADAESTQPVKDPVTATFERIQRERGADGHVSRDDLVTAAHSPEQFAIVYAQLNGLVASAGDAGMVLTRYVPWTGYVPPKNFASLAHIASLSRAMNSDAESRRLADNVVLEMLRNRFAPNMTEKLDVGAGR